MIFQAEKLGEQDNKNPILENDLSKTRCNPHPPRLGATPSSRQTARERVVRFVLLFQIQDMKSQNHYTRTPSTRGSPKREQPARCCLVSKKAGGVRESLLLFFSPKKRLEGLPCLI